MDGALVTGAFVAGLHSDVPFSAPAPGGMGHVIALERVWCGGPATVVLRAAREDLVTGEPTLFLTVGLPATGKTTAARRLEAEHHALRLTKDEWMKALYGEQNPTSASDVIEGRLIEIGLRALEIGTNVVIDFGLWGRDERSALRQAAAERAAQVKMYYFEVTAAEQRRRLDRRQMDEPHTTWPISEDELAGWGNIMQVPTPGEVDGTEPIDDPPAGFGSWDEWRGYRWPSSIA